MPLVSVMLHLSEVTSGIKAVMDSIEKHMGSDGESEKSEPYRTSSSAEPLLGVRPTGDVLHAQPRDP
eukprot:2787801-Amphidinium_carterae.1